jgi:hypothetical protein
MRTNKTSITLLLASLLIATVMTLPINVSTATTTTATSGFNVFVVDDLSVKTLALKAIQLPNGQVQTEEGFEILPESVVQLRQGETLKVFTTSGQQIESVKIAGQDKRNIELPQISNSEWSISAIPQGSYLLDVIVAMNTREKMAYETVLIVLGPNQTEVEEDDVNQIIQTFLIIGIWIGFDPPPINTTKPPVDNITKPIPPPSRDCPQLAGNGTDGPCPPPVGDPVCLPNMTKNEEGECVPLQPECPPDSSLIDGVCVPLEQPEPIFDGNPIFPVPTPGDEATDEEGSDEDDPATDEDSDFNDDNNDDENNDNSNEETDDGNDSNEENDGSDNTDSDNNDDDGPVNFGPDGPMD